MLNAWLYNRLRALFGTVHLANQGVPLQVEKIYDPIFNKKKTIIKQRGETYSVNCPFCIEKVGRPDKRYRLWINHHWGVPSEDGGTRFWDLAICYNENCLRESMYLERLKHLVYETSIVNYTPLGGFQTKAVSRPIELPDNLKPINTLPVTHPCYQYLIDRNFSPDELWEKYEVYYCSENSNKMVKKRIIIPIKMDNELVSWQARGYDNENTHVKYYTCPNSNISNVLYGWDAVENHMNYCILVEGVTDVWRLGPPALALFGCRLSEAQLNRIVKRFYKVVVLLDGDVFADKNKKNVENMIERIRKYVTPLVIKLDGDVDPAALSKEDAETLLWAIQKKLGVV